MVGTTIAHYRVLEKIGGGGMGVVYKAEDLRLGRLVALKCLPDEFANDPAVIERFRREARAVSALNHPNICTLHDLVEADGRTFLVMELLEGRNLREIILEHGALPLERLLGIAIDVADGLAAAHEKGILHRDLKPANIMVTDRGSAKILDFGLAKIGYGQAAAAAGVDPESRTGGWAMGTIAYMSPEQALGKPLDQRSDLFSLGAILYEMATGKLPFTGDTTGVLFLSIVQGAPTPPRTINPGVPEALQHIIDKCLEKDREQRYQGAPGLLADLRRLQAAPSSTSGPTSETERPGTRLRSWAPWLAGAAIVLLAAAGTISFAVRGRASALTSTDTIVVADLANMTGDPVFDHTLRDALTTALGQSPFLNIADDARIASTLGLMRRAPGERLTRQLAREVCQRTNSKAYLTGAIGKRGASYTIELQAFVCVDDRPLATSAASADSRDKVLEALGDAGSRIRRKLGESLPSSSEFDRPLLEVTTSSLEALQALSTGRDVAREKGYQAALPFFKRAVELDPNFAAAYVGLGSVYGNLQQRDLAAENYQRAYELRNRVTERERYSIESRQSFAAGDLARDIEICLRWVSAYPNDSGPRNRLGLNYLYLGQIDKAAEQFRQGVSDGSVASWVNLVIAYRRLGRFEEAERVLDAARTRGLDSEAIRIQRYMLAFFKGDAAGMQEEIARAMGRPAFEDRLLSAQALIEAYYGRLDRSRALAAQARASAEKASASGRSAVYLVSEAINEGYLGNTAKAKDLATRCLTVPNSRNIVQRTALALALAGDNASATKLLRELTNNPHAVLIQNYVVPTIRAHIEMNDGNAARAIEVLQAAVPYDLAIAEFSSLQPAYARGLAYLQLRKGPEATREFQKLIDNRGAVYDSILGALARLQRARARVLSEDLDGARTDYQDFLAIWKDADPDMPLLAQAKAEYGRLK